MCVEHDLLAFQYVTRVLAAKATGTPQILRGKPAVHEPGLSGDRTGLVFLPLDQDCADSVLSATFFKEGSLCSHQHHRLCCYSAAAFLPAP